LISLIGVIKDVTKSISLNPKFAGDLVYIIGETKDETGGSEYLLSQGFTGNKIPKVDIETALKIYEMFEEATDKRLISSAISIGIGGLITSITKKAIAGMLGMEIDLSLVPKSADLSREDFLLFSETQTRFLVTIDPKNQKEFEKLFAKTAFAQIGKITSDQNLIIKGFSNQELIKTNIPELNKHYRKTFKDW
ncbi:MAG: AIR synthase-related protein, partial [Candidatus Gracilibacteria bacterium]